jgi:hypothetical protein
MWTKAENNRLIDFMKRCKCAPLNSVQANLWNRLCTLLPGRLPAANKLHWSRTFAETMGLCEEQAAAATLEKISETPVRARRKQTYPRHVTDLRNLNMDAWCRYVRPL